MFAAKETEDDPQKGKIRERMAAITEKGQLLEEMVTKTYAQTIHVLESVIITEMYEVKALLFQPCTNTADIFQTTLNNTFEA